VLQWLSILAAIVFVGWVLYENSDQLAEAFDLTPRIFALISISAVCTFLINGIELQVLAGRFGKHVPFKDSMLLGLMVSTLNYLPMKSGTMLNGVLMKVRYGVSFAHFTALVAGSSVIHLWIAMTLAGIALLVVGMSTGLALLFIAVSNGVVVALIIWGRLHPGGTFDEHGSRLMRAFGRGVDGMGLIYSSGRLLLIEAVINIALVVLAALRTMWAFESLSIDAGFATSLVVAAVGIFAGRLSVIPGGLGFKEGGAAAGAAMVGMQPAVGLTVSIIDRAVTLVWLLVLGVPATLYLQRKTGIDLATAAEARRTSDSEG
jgi:uncharacterized membrane protein YbhN (UPF0104 family)